MSMFEIVVLCWLVALTWLFVGVCVLVARHEHPAAYTPIEECCPNRANRCANPYPHTLGKCYDSGPYKILDVDGSLHGFPLGQPCAVCKGPHGQVKPIGTLHRPPTDEEIWLDKGDA